MSDKKSPISGNAKYLFPLNRSEDTNTMDIKGVKLGACGIILENNTKIIKKMEAVVYIFLFIYSSELWLFYNF